MKTLKLAVWAFSLNLLPDSTLFVIDIHQNMTISPILTPFDQFQISLTFAVTPNLILSYATQAIPHNSCDSCNSRNLTQPVLNCCICFFRAGICPKISHFWNKRGALMCPSKSVLFLNWWWNHFFQILNKGENSRMIPVGWFQANKDFTGLGGLIRSGAM